MITCWQGDPVRAVDITFGIKEECCWSFKGPARQTTFCLMHNECVFSRTNARCTALLQEGPLAPKAAGRRS